MLGHLAHLHEGFPATVNRDENRLVLAQHLDRVAPERAGDLVGSLVHGPPVRAVLEQEPPRRQANSGDLGKRRRVGQWHVGAVGHGWWILAGCAQLSHGNANPPSVHCR